MSRICQLSRKECRTDVKRHGIGLARILHSLFGWTLVGHASHVCCQYPFTVPWVMRSQLGSRAEASACESLRGIIVATCRPLDPDCKTVGGRDLSVKVANMGF